MTLTELIKQSGGSGVSVTIGLEDLRQWHAEVLANSRDLNDSNKEKAEEEFLSPASVCQMLSVSRSSLTRWQKAGYLVPSRMGGQCRYKRSEIDAILNTKMK